ncbi:hypothetical protein [Paraburkholderia sp.]|uniref:hypothetical protein n=1 Tax=Paraburkholderia sp. TaxID=1926495 RepID=UPI002B482570|nr:hypothetical protein [Paraburkholderia sp.]
MPIKVDIHALLAACGVVTVHTHARAYLLAQFVDKRLKRRMAFMDAVIDKRAAARDRQKNFFSIEFVVEVVDVTILVVYQIVLVDRVVMIRHADPRIEQRREVENRIQVGKREQVRELVRSAFDV